MNRLIAIFAICVTSVLGQAVSSSSKDAGIAKPVVIQGGVAGFGPIGITGAMAGPMATVAGAPYSAEAVTERVQTLADGNRIVQNTTGSVARDSQGRVRRDEALPGLTSSSGDAPHLVMIEDPVAGVHWSLDARTKTAVKLPFVHVNPDDKAHALGPFALPPPGPDKMWFASTATPGPGLSIQTIVKDQFSDSDTKKTDLGTQTMEGVPAQGTRITRTLPAGAVGNEQPIVITTETWYSPDLKVLVMSKTSDPRMGEISYRLMNIDRAEPAANLFQVPDDYTVKDQPANNVIYREFKK
ncbi:MAG: hypothetical protein JO061_02725 [Acidobacteriaceae bacterium]|nr:hypothetical protein [Acidobacteriaceae bacterium]